MTQDRRVAVIGLGYVGLPLAISFVEAGLTVEGIDAYPPRVAELNAGSSPIDDVSNERLAAASHFRPDRRRSGGRPHPRMPTRSSSAFPTPITSTKDPDLAPVISAAEAIRGHLRAGQLVILQSTTFPGTTTGPFREVLEQIRPEGGRRLRSRLRPGAGQSGRSGQREQGRAATRRRHDGRRHGARGRASAEHQRAGRDDVLAGRRGAGQAPGERLPQHQHRVRQQPRAAVRADGARRLGGHQRRGDQAVRVHEVHARTRRRRSLHPGRSVLPRLARPRVRLHRSVHRARRRHQLRDAAPCRRPGRRGAQRPWPGAQGRQGRCPWCRLQAQRP